MYTYTCRNIINNNDEWTHFFRKIYLSHFIRERVVEGLCVRGELETEQTATYWPPSSSDYSSTSFLILLGCSTGGPEGLNPLLGAGSHCHKLQLELQLTDSNSLTPTLASDYIIVWRPPASRGHCNCTDFNLFTGQGDIFNIFDRMHLLLDWRLDWRSIC